MVGCSIGRFFQVTVAGGSYQEGLTTHIQGVPTGLLFTEEEIYSDLLQRKPGQGELSSPRREPDIPVIYSGVNAANTVSIHVANTINLFVNCIYLTDNYNSRSIRLVCRNNFRGMVY